jgi:multidrug efflux pump subunit AcrA (membrane-fusion protein)
LLANEIPRFPILPQGEDADQLLDKPDRAELRRKKWKNRLRRALYKGRGETSAAVHLRINALPEVKLPDCKVSRTGFAIDEKTGTMPVEIDVPNPKLVLRPGLFITASIHLDKKTPAGAVIVPRLVK